MKIPFETARVFPKLYVILLAFGEELSKFFKDSSGMDLIWMQFYIEYLFGRVDGVGDDNYFRNFFFVTGLVKTTSNCKEFCFSASDEDHMVNCFNKRFVLHVNMQDQSGYVMFDASVRYYKCCMWR